MDPLKNIENTQEVKKPQEPETVSPKENGVKESSPILSSQFPIDFESLSQRFRQEEEFKKRQQEQKLRVDKADNKIKSIFKDLNNLFQTEEKTYLHNNFSSVRGFSPALNPPPTVIKQRPIRFDEIDSSRREQILFQLNELESLVQSFGDSAWKTFDKQNPWFSKLKNDLTGENWKLIQARQTLEERKGTFMGVFENIPVVGSFLSQPEEKKLLGIGDPTSNFVARSTAGIFKLGIATVPAFIKAVYAIGIATNQKQGMPTGKLLEIQQQQKKQEELIDKFWGLNPNNSLSTNTIKNFIDKGDYVGAILAFLSDVPQGTSEQIPQIAAFALSGGLSAEFRILGAYGTAYIQHFNENINKQLETNNNIKIDKALVSSAINSATDALSFELIFGKFFNKSGAKGLTYEQLLKIKDKNTIGLYLKELGKYAGTELPTEVFQELTSRWQADLPLFDEAAMKVYRDTAYAVSTSFPLGVMGSTSERNQAKAFYDDMISLKDVDLNSQAVLARLIELPDAMLEQIQIPKDKLQNLKLAKFNISNSIFPGTNLSPEKVTEKLEQNEKDLKSGEYYKQNNTAAASLKFILNNKEVSEIYKRILLKQVVTGQILLVSNLNDLPKNVAEGITKNDSVQLLSNSSGFNFRVLTDTGSKKVILGDNLWNSIVSEFEKSGKEFKLSDVEKAFFEEAEKTILHEALHDSLHKFGYNYQRILGSIGSIMSQAQGSSVVNYDSFNRMSDTIDSIFLSGDTDTYLDINNILLGLKNIHKELDNHFSESSFDNASTFVKSALELNKKLMAKQKQLIRFLAQKKDEKKINQSQSDLIINAYGEYSSENHYNKFYERFSDNQTNNDLKSLWKSAFNIFPSGEAAYTADPLYFYDEIAAYSVELDPEAIRDTVEKMYGLSSNLKKLSVKLKNRDKNKIFQSIVLNKRLAGRSFQTSNRVTIKLNSVGELFYPGTAEVNTLKDLQIGTALNLLQLDLPSPTPFSQQSFSPTRELINRDINSANVDAETNTASYIPSIKSDMDLSNPNLVDDTEKKLLDTKKISSLLISSQPTEETDDNYFDLVNEQLAEIQQVFSDKFTNFVEKTKIIPGSWLLNEGTGEIIRFAGFNQIGDDLTVTALRQKKEYDVTNSGFIVFNSISNISLNEFDNFKLLSGNQIQFYILEKNNKLLRELTQQQDKPGVDSVNFTEESILNILRKHFPFNESMGITEQISEASIWAKNILRGIRFKMKTDKETGILQSIYARFLGPMFYSKRESLSQTQRKKEKWKKLKDIKIQGVNEELIRLMELQGSDELINSIRQDSVASFSLRKRDGVIKMLFDETHRTLNKSKQEKYDKLITEMPEDYLFDLSEDLTEGEKEIARAGSWRNKSIELSGLHSEIVKDENFAKELNNNILLFLGNKDNGFTTEEIDQYQKTSSQEIKTTPEDTANKEMRRKIRESLLSSGKLSEQEQILVLQGEIKAEMEDAIAQAITQIEDAIASVLDGHYALDYATKESEIEDWYQQNLESAKRQLNFKIEILERQIKKIKSQKMPASWLAFETVAKDEFGNIKKGLLEEKEKLEKEKKDILLRFQELKNKSIQDSENSLELSELYQQWKDKDAEIEELDAMINHPSGDDIVSEFETNKERFRVNYNAERLSSLGFALAQVIEKAKNGSFNLYIPNIKKINEEVDLLNKQLEEASENYNMAISIYNESKKEIHLQTVLGYRKLKDEIGLKIEDYKNIQKKEETIKEMYLDELKSFNKEYTEDDWVQWRIEHALSRYIGVVASTAYLKLVTVPKTDAAYSAKLFSEYQETIGNKYSGPGLELGIDEQLKISGAQILTAEDKSELGWDNLGTSQKKKGINILFKILSSKDKNARLEIFNLSMTSISRRIEKQLEFARTNGQGSFIPYYKNNIEQYNKDARLYALYKTVLEYSNPSIPKSIEISYEVDVVDPKTGLTETYKETKRVTLTDNQFRKIVSQGTKVYGAYVLYLKIPTTIINEKGEKVEKRVPTKFRFSNAKNLRNRMTQAHQQNTEILSEFLRPFTKTETRRIKELEKEILELDNKIQEAKKENQFADTSDITKKIMNKFNEISKIQDSRDFNWDWNWSDKEKEIFYNVLQDNYKKLNIDWDKKNKGYWVAKGIIEFRSNVNRAINVLSGMYEYEVPLVNKTISLIQKDYKTNVASEDAKIENISDEFLRSWLLAFPKMEINQKTVGEQSKNEFTELDWLNYQRYKSLNLGTKQSLIRMLHDHYSEQINIDYEGTYSPGLIENYMSMPIERVWETQNMLPPKMEIDNSDLGPVTMDSEDVSSPSVSQIDPSKRIKNLRLLIAKAVGFTILGGVSISSIFSKSRVEAGRTIGEELFNKLPFIGAAFGAYYLIKGSPKVLQSYIKNISQQSQKYKGPFLGRTKFILKTILDKKYGFSETSKLELTRFQEQWSTFAQQLIQVTNKLQNELVRYCHIGDDLNAGIDTAKSLRYVRLLTTYFDPVDTVLNSNPEIGPDKETLLAPMAREIFGDERFTIARENLKKFLAKEYDTLSSLSSSDPDQQLEIDKQKNTIEKLYRRWFGFTPEEEVASIQNYESDLIKLVGNPAYITGFPSKKKLKSLTANADLNSIALEIRKEIIQREQINALNQLPPEVQTHAKEIKKIIEIISKTLLMFDKDNIIKLDTSKSRELRQDIKQSIAREISLKLGEYLPVVYEAFDSHQSWKEQPDFDSKKEAFRLELRKSFEYNIKVRIAKDISKQKSGNIWGYRKVAKILANKEEMQKSINEWEKSHPLEAQQLNEYLNKTLEDLPIFETEKSIKKKGPQTIEELFELRKQAILLSAKYNYAQLEKKYFNQFTKITKQIEGSDYIKFKESNSASSYVPTAIKKAIFEQKNIKLLDSYQKYLGKLENPLERAAVGSVKNIEFISSVTMQKTLREFLIKEGFASTDASTEFSEIFNNTEEAQSDAVRRLKQLPFLANLYYTPYGKQLTLAWLDDASKANLWTKGIGITKLIQVILNTSTWFRQIISDGTAAIAYGGMHLFKKELWYVNWQMQNAFRYGKPIIYDEKFNKAFAKLISPELLEHFTIRDSKTGKVKNKPIEEIIKQIMGAGIFEENILAKDVLSNLGTNQPLFSLLSVKNEIKSVSEFYKNLIDGTFTKDEFQKVLKYGQYSNRNSIKSAISAASYFFGTTNNLGRLSVYLSHLNALAKVKTFTPKELARLSYSLTHRTVPRFENYPELIKFASRYGILNPYIFFEWMGTRGLINQAKTISMLRNAQEFEKWLGRKPTKEEMLNTEKHSKELFIKWLVGLGLNGLYLYSVLFGHDDDDKLSGENKNSIRKLFMGYMANKPLGVEVDRSKEQLIITSNEYMSYFAPSILSTVALGTILSELFKEINQDGPFDYNQSESSGAIKKLNDLMSSKSTESFLNPGVKGLSVLATGRDAQTGKLVNERGTPLIQNVQPAVESTLTGLTPPDFKRIQKVIDGRYTILDWLQSSILGRSIERVPFDKFWTRVFYGPSQNLKDIMNDFNGDIGEIRDGEKIDYHINEYSKKYIVSRNTLNAFFKEWKNSNLQTPIGYVNQLTSFQRENNPLVNDGFVQVSMLYGAEKILSYIYDPLTGEDEIKTDISGNNNKDVAIFAKDMYLRRIPPSTLIDTVVNTTSNFLVKSFGEARIGERKKLKNGREETFYYWDDKHFNREYKEKMVTHINEALPYLYASMMINSKVDDTNRRGNILDVDSDGMKVYITPKSSSLSILHKDAITKYLQDGGKREIVNDLSDPEDDIKDMFRIEYEMNNLIVKGRQLDGKIYLDPNGNFLFTGKDAYQIERTLQFLLAQTFITNPKDKTKSLLAFESFSSMKNAKLGFFDLNKFPKKNNINIFVDPSGNTLPMPTTSELLQKIVEGKIINTKEKITTTTNQKFVPEVDDENN